MTAAPHGRTLPGKTQEDVPMDPNNISVAEMERFVARFARLRGSEEAFVDSRLPGSRRSNRRPVARIRPCR